MSNLNSVRRHTDLDPTLSATNLLALRGILNHINLHPGFYESNRERLAAADLAYLSHGASLDDGPLGSDTFHEDLVAFRRGTTDPQTRTRIRLRMRRAMFDHVGPFISRSSPEGVIVDKFSPF